MRDLNLIEYELNGDGGLEGGGDLSGGVVDPPPAEAPSFTPEHAARLDETFSRVDSIYQMIEQSREEAAQAEAQRQAAAAQQPTELPEWDPYNPDVVRAYQAAQLRDTLGEPLTRMAETMQSLQERAEKAEQAERAVEGGRVADGLLEEFQAGKHGFEQYPEYIRENLPRDAALALSTLYVEHGVEPQQAFHYVTNELARWGHDLAKHAVTQELQRLGVIASAGAEPSAGAGSATLIPSDTPRDGESPYRAAGDRWASRQSPVQPAGV